MLEAFKLLPVAEDEGPIGLHPVCRQAHQVQDRSRASFQPCTEADGAVAQQEAAYDNSGNSGDGERDRGGSEDSKIVQKGTGAVGNGSRAGGFGAGAGADTGVDGTSGRTPGGVSLQYQGHRGCDGPVPVRGALREGPGDGKAGRAGRVGDGGEET